MNMKTQKHDPSETRRTGVQWLLLLTSLAIVLGLVGYIAYDHFTKGNDPPAVMVEAAGKPSSRTDGTYQLNITVRNEGDLPAENVIVHVSGSGQETADVQIDFLSGHEEQTHTVIFSEKPGDGRLRYTVGLLQP